MPIITLTSDYGIKDHYVASLKGSIYTNNEDVKIVDISHKIPHKNLKQGAYFLISCYEDFPEGTVHIIGIAEEKTPVTEHLILSFNKQYFICADNGILNMFLPSNAPHEVRVINCFQKENDIFPAKNTFSKIACHIIEGKDLDEVSYKREELEIKPINQIFITDDQNSLRASILYIDHNGNAVTNVTKELFEKVRAGRNFTMNVGYVKISKIHNCFSDSINFKNDALTAFHGDKLAIFNSSNFLEITIYNSSPKENNDSKSLFGLEVGKQFTIEFKS